MRPLIHSRRRGFSLIELMVACGLSVLAVGVGSMTLVAQYRKLQASDLTRASNDEVRSALQLIEPSLRQLGWGIDPRYAIDMKYQCAATPCRDHVTSPDEIAFVTRNPVYRWRDFNESACATSGGCFDGNAWAVTDVDLASSPRTVTVTLAAGVNLEKGRVVLVTCALGQNPVMLTLSAAVSGPGSVVLTPQSTNAVPYNDFNSLLACHKVTGAGLFLVDRYRYFIQTLNSTPWLMLDTGVDIDGDGSLPPTDQDDLIPVAKDVEDLQVAYALTPTAAFTAPDSNTDWILGNDSGSTTPEEPDFSATAPTYSTATTDASRFNKNPANVRAIRVSLRLRSDRTDKTHGAAWTGESLLPVENSNVTLSGGNYRRYVIRTDITLRNMDSTTSFFF